MKVAVCGLGHLGITTAACLAKFHDVTAYDPDERLVHALASVTADLSEPEVREMVYAAIRCGSLKFTHDLEDVRHAHVDVVWVTVDTPTKEDVPGQSPDVQAVRSFVHSLFPALLPGCEMIISSQVPVGTTADIEARWRAYCDTYHLTHYLPIAYSPENLKRGQAVQRFLNPDRVIVGIRPGVAYKHLNQLLEFVVDIVLVTVEEAETIKHALNGFLALCICYANEIARFCVYHDIDPMRVMEHVQSDRRVGYNLPLTPGGPIRGGTLLRDVGYMTNSIFMSDFGGFARTPILYNIEASNDVSLRESNWICNGDHHVWTVSRWCQCGTKNRETAGAA